MKNFSERHPILLAFEIVFLAFLYIAFGIALYSFSFSAPFEGIDLPKEFIMLLFIPFPVLLVVLANTVISLLESEDTILGNDSANKSSRSEPRQ